MATPDEIAREATRLRVPMSHVPKDREYLPVLAYRIGQEIHAIEFRLADLRSLLRRVEELEENDDDAPEHATAEECDLEYEGHVAAPGFGVAYRCRSCRRPWLRLGSGYVDPRERVYELSPEDVV